MNETMVRVQGGIPLKGNVVISGSKHTALAILGVLPLLRGSVKLMNLPEIRDVQHMLKINESLGVVSSRTGKNEYVFSAEEMSYSEEELWRVSQLRSSILYLGSILLSCGHVLLPTPGGDRLGARPIEGFLRILDVFNIRHELHERGVTAYCDALKGDREFDLFSIIGNNRSALTLMLAYANQGKTKIKNVLVAPEIVHLCQFLQLISQGMAVIEGIGTDTISISSPGLEIIRQKRCPGPDYVIGFDKCEIPFWICASALTMGNITCSAPGQGNISAFMERMRNALLEKAGIPLEILSADQFRINCGQQEYRPKAFDLLSTYHEMDSIAFDACPIFSTILFKAYGNGSFQCYRYGFERIRWAEQLSKIGATVRIKRNVLFVEGCERLLAKGSIVLEGDDIRSASSVLLAALATEGKPLFVKGVEHIERGMEDIVAKLQAVGASIDVPKTETPTS